MPDEGPYYFNDIKGPLAGLAWDCERVAAAELDFERWSSTWRGFQVAEPQLYDCLAARAKRGVLDSSRGYSGTLAGEMTTPGDFSS